MRGARGLILDSVKRVAENLARPEGLEPRPLFRRQLLYPVELRTAEAASLRHERHPDSSKALLTTLTELKAMAVPATMGFKPQSRQRNAQHVVAEGPEQVLMDLALWFGAKYPTQKQSTGGRRASR